MEVSAKLTFIRIAPQKARLVANQIRGQKVDRALEILKFSQKKRFRARAKGRAAKILKRTSHITVEVSDS